MVNQMNWWILVQSGFIGSFDLPYMIQVMSDHKWSWSGSSQRNAPQDNLGFWIPCHGFQSRNCIPDSLSVELGFWIPIVSRIPNSLSCIFRNPMPRIPESRFPYMGRSSMHSIFMMRSKFCFLLTCDNQWTSVYFPHIHSLTLLNNQERQPRDHIMITCLYLNKQSELSFHVRIHIFMATALSQATS